jgi:type IV pilus assembly protein PilP
MKPLVTLRVVGLMLPVLLLGACSEGSVNEVREWMAREAQNVKPRVSPLLPPKKFIPFGYVNKEVLDPFNQSKLFDVLTRISQATAKQGPVIDLNRTREHLEGFPLDALKMVGTLEKKGTVVALVQADKSIYQVKVGQYLGQNYGKVVKVSETEIEIKEIVKDAVGDNVEREAKLELQESKK